MTLGSPSALGSPSGLLSCLFLIWSSPSQVQNKGALGSALDCVLLTPHPGPGGPIVWCDLNSHFFSGEAQIHISRPHLSRKLRPRCLEMGCWRSLPGRCPHTPQMQWEGTQTAFLPRVSVSSGRPDAHSPARHSEPIISQSPVDFTSSICFTFFALLLLFS